MSHTDPHQTTSISQHVPPLMTINVNPVHPFVHTHKTLPHTKPLLLEWHLIFSIDENQFSPNERLARLSVHKGVECNLEEFVRNTKQKKLSFTVWIRSKNQAIYQQVNTSSCTAVVQLWMWWLYSDPQKATTFLNRGKVYHYLL